MLTADNLKRNTWIEVPSDSDFPIQNIPFGVFMTVSDTIAVGTRIGNIVVNLNALHQLGYFGSIELPKDVFLQNSLNNFIILGKLICQTVRNRVAEIFDIDNPELQFNEEHKRKVLFKVDKVQMLLPVFAQDYTDFYSSREHAENVGTMFRGKDNSLMPNWLHLPVAYHGRSSSIIVSGVDIYRPKGQMMPDGQNEPVFGPSKLLDFELEMAFITTNGKSLGKSISTDEAEDYIFGMVIFNDWSARDIQKWEYLPLGPFLGKNFASSISPWVVTLDALEPFRTPGLIQQNPTPLSYLHCKGSKTFDIELEVFIQTPNGEENKVCHSNFKYLYWNMNQQLAHHTVNGCNINTGDIMASGTISGPTPNSYGSMLELSWLGTKPLKMKDGSERKFLLDGDTVIMRAHSEKDDLRIGLGKVCSKILPAL